MVLSNNPYVLVDLEKYILTENKKLFFKDEIKDKKQSTFEVYSDNDICYITSTENSINENVFQNHLLYFYSFAHESLQAN